MNKSIKHSSIKNRKKREHIVDIVCFALVFLLALIMLFPLWWIFRSSLMTNAEIGSLSFFPSRWLWSNYGESMDVFPYFSYLGNTMIIVIPAVVFGTSTAVLCGYSFARLYFRGRKFFFALCMSSILLPPMVTLIPLYIGWVRFLNLSGTYWPLVLPWICGGGAFNIFLIRQFMLTIPRELDEAAMIDGAGRLRTLVQILVPQLKPAVIVVALFIFLNVWNDVLQQTVYLTDPNMYTIALGLRRFSGAYGTNWRYAMAATCLSILPGLIIYMIGQRWFVEGIVLTGLKD